MRRLAVGSTMAGLVILSLLVASDVQAKPWRNIESIPASRIKWMGLAGSDGDDQKHVYSITAQGTLFKPYPRKPPYPANVQTYVESWLLKHPDARLIPVEAYPFFSAEVAWVYVWIVDGDENLNLHLVEEGFFRGSAQVPTLRAADLLISTKEYRAFRKKLMDAEIAAANSKKGIWQQNDWDAGMPPGKLVYPGITALAELERQAQAAPEPEPTPAFGPETLEEELLRIFFGDDATATYAARVELLRRAETRELSFQAFSSLITAGLDKQTPIHWDSFYGPLIHLAYQQGKLSEELLKRYARQAVTIQFVIKTDVLEPNTPLVKFTIKRKGSFARTRAPKVINKRQSSELLITTAFHIDDMKVDSEPALNGRTGKLLNDTWLYQAWRGTKVLPITVMTKPPVAPGPHKLKGVLSVRYFTGIDAWNIAGQRKALPEGVKILLEERYDIDLDFTMEDY